MADWPLSESERLEFSTVTASRGAANAKGAYAQLLAATTFQYSALTINLVGIGGGGQCYLVDIAMGAGGAEQVVVPNILFDTARGIYQNAISITLPICLPTGARLSARVQEVGGAGTRDVQVGAVGRAGGFNRASASCGAVNCYGANVSTTNGVLVDSGATLNTFGAWTEITSATARDHAGLVAVLGTNQQTGALIDSHYHFQVAVGASGSEVALVEFISGMSSGINRLAVSSFEIGASVPSGTRLAMRSKCVASGAAGARHSTAILLGY